MKLKLLRAERTASDHIFRPARGVIIHYRRYTDETDRDVTLTYEPKKPCKVCGTRKRYTNNRNCVRCKTKGGA